LLPGEMTIPATMASTFPALKMSTSRLTTAARFVWGAASKSCDRRMAMALEDGTSIANVLKLVFIVDSTTVKWVSLFARVKFFQDSQKVSGNVGCLP